MVGMRYIILIFAVVFLLALNPVHALTNITTPSIPGCISSLKFNATNHTALFPGQSTEFNVTIWDVKCGIKHVTLDLVNIPGQWYNVSPELIPSVAPFQAKDFKVTINLPSNVSPNGYVANYTIHTEERNFNEHELYIKVLEQEIQEELPQISDGVYPDEKGVSDIYSEKNTLHIFILIIIITAIVYLIYAGKLKPKEKPKTRKVRKKAKKKRKRKST